MSWPMKGNTLTESPRKRRQKKEEKEWRVSHQPCLMIMVGTQEIVAILSLQTTRPDLLDLILKETAIDILSKHAKCAEDIMVQWTTYNNLKSWASMGKKGRLRSRGNVYYFTVGGVGLPV